MREHRLSLDALLLPAGLTPDIRQSRSPSQSRGRSVDSTHQRLINQCQNRFEQDGHHAAFLIFSIADISLNSWAAFGHKQSGGPLLFRVGRGISAVGSPMKPTGVGRDAAIESRG